MAKDAITETPGEPTTETQEGLPEHDRIENQPGEYDISPPEMVAPPSGGTGTQDAHPGATGKPSYADIADEGISDSGVSSALAEQARSYGITDAEISNLDASALKTVMGIYDRSIAEMGRAAMHQQQNWQGPPQEVQDQLNPQTQQFQQPSDQQLLQQQPQSDDSQQQQQTWALTKYEKELDDTWDEEVKDYLEGLSEHQHQVNQQVMQQLGHLQHGFNMTSAGNDAAESERYEKEMDGFFDTLGNEWVGVFGGGPMRELPPGETRDNRNKFAEELGSLMAGDMQYGREAMPFDQLQKRTLHSAFGQQLLEIERGNIGNHVRTRRKQGLPRPSGKEGSSMTGREAAAKLANDWYADRGMQPTPARMPIDI